MSHNLNSVNQLMSGQSLLKIHTGSLLDSLDKVTLQKVLEEPCMKYPLLVAANLYMKRIQERLVEWGYLSLTQSRFIRTKTTQGAKLGPMGTILSHGYTVITINKTKWLQSYLVYLWFTGNLPKIKEEIDHIDGNPCNDYPGNLRLVDRITNCRNARMPVHNTSGYTGVSYRVDIDKYRAYIKVNQKQISIGSFDTAVKAHTARQAYIAAHSELGFTTRHGR